MYSYNALFCVIYMYCCVVQQVRHVECTVTSSSPVLSYRFIWVLFESHIKHGVWSHSKHSVLNINTVNGCYFSWTIFFVFHYLTLRFRLLWVLTAAASTFSCSVLLYIYIATAAAVAVPVFSLLFRFRFCSSSSSSSFRVSNSSCILLYNNYCNWFLVWFWFIYFPLLWVKLLYSYCSVLCYLRVLS